MYGRLNMLERLSLWFNADVFSNNNLFYFQQLTCSLFALHRMKDGIQCSYIIQTKQSPSVKAAFKHFKFTF